MVKNIVLGICLCLFASISFAADSTTLDPVGVGVSPAAPAGAGPTCNWSGWKLAGGFVFSTTSPEDCRCDQTTSTLQMYCSGGQITESQTVVVCVDASCGHAK
jgi:hypothetical protein